ncbi:hypothetical protein [Streptomyces niger]|uniref:hypothetical protein n=1 Tax=Streptomyces niger TaxID=66373 RepID=UPI00069AD90D|nr:hypothetical protein [Streptomyces niger]
MRPVPPALVLAACTAVLAAAAPAVASGAGELLSPAYGNGCANFHHGATADGTMNAAPATVGGGLLGLPVAGPLNQCGGVHFSLDGTSAPSVLNVPAGLCTVPSHLSPADSFVSQSTGVSC